MAIVGSTRGKQTDLWRRSSNDGEAVWQQVPEESRIECLELIAKLLRSIARAELQSKAACRQGERT
jgi:hypothetical protein